MNEERVKARDRHHWNWYEGNWSESERKADRLEARFRRRRAWARLWASLFLPFSKLLGEERLTQLYAWADEQGVVRFTPKARAQWVELALTQLDDGPERVQKCREILLGFPSNLLDELRSALIGLTIEFRRHEMALEQGITEFNELDRYLCRLDEEGYILDNVPWAVLKASRRRVLPSDYRRFKQRVLEANPTTRKELDDLIWKLFEESAQRADSFYTTELDPSWEEQRLFLEEAQAVFDRIFELKFPEFVTRIPGQPPFLDREAQRKHDDPGDIILHIAHDNPSGFRRFTNYLGHCLYLLADFLDDRLGLKKRHD